MAFDPPDGILDIGNATLRVGKLEVAETSGLNQGLQNIIKNDLLITENTEYSINHHWGIKLPTTWVAEFEVKGHSGKYIDFNFYNENSASNALGYNLTFMDTTMTLRYDGGSALGGGAATIPTIVGAYRKVNIFFERGVISVSIDGTRYLYFKESDGYNQGLGVASRVVSATGSAFVNLFIEQNASNSKFKNLRIVNGRFISDKTSNIAFIGGNLGVGVNSPQETLDIRGNMHFNRVSNVSSVSVDSNVVTEYTGPHDRPLRKYPEVSLTADDNLSTSGYKASVSSLLTGNNAFNVFDATGATTYWHSQYPYYTHVTGTYNPGQSSSGTGTPSGTLPTTQLIPTSRGGDSHQGEWIKLQMPTRIKLEEVRVYASNRASTNIYQMPKDIAIAGSNDGTNWYLVDSGTLRTGIRESYGMASLPVTTSSYYSYLALIVKTIDNQGANYSAIEIANIEYYGHEEGSGSLDTTLKSVYNVPATTGTQLEVYYDAKDLAEMPSTVTDLSPNTNTGALSTSPPTLDTTDGIESFKFDASSSQRITSTIDTSYWGTNKLHSVSFWLKADTVGGKFNIFQIGNAAANEVSAFWISDGSADSNGGNSLNWWSYGGDSTLKTSSFSWALDTWYHIALTFDGSTKKLYVNGKYIEFSVNNTVPTANLPTGIPASASLLVGSSSVGGGGDYFDGSIANFRVYGAKVLNAGQVQELYDYQKDYFLGSKSQVTLYKGHLGVGVTEPSGQLELAGDERIQEYPPRSLTGYETLVEGHGVFCVYSTDDMSQIGATGYGSTKAAWYAFMDGNTASGNQDEWVSSYDRDDGTSGTIYDIGSGDSANSYNTARRNRQLGGIYGEWIVFKSPYPIKVQSIDITVDHTWSQESARRYTVLGSNDGNTWEIIRHVQSGDGNGTTLAASTSPTAGLVQNGLVNSTKYYTHTGIVVTQLTNYQHYLRIPRIRLFGTPGPTTLDKGSLTLGRSLDVPRISRYDVDTETPRPEKLVLDYDTTVNDSPTDISEKGNHGVFYGDAKYSAPDKAFKFDGTDDVLHVNGVTGLPTGDAIYTLSCWVNVDATQTTTNPSVFYFGSSWATSQLAGIYFRDGNKVAHDIGSTNVYTTNPTLIAGQWHHIVVVKRGTGNIVANTAYQGIFVDGVEITQLSINGSPRSQTLGSSQQISVGHYFYGTIGSGGSDGFVGLVSNPKIYSVVLEPSEIKKLYNLGRTGRSMVISDTAVGIGKVPEAQLDVRGNLRVSGHAFPETVAPRYYTSIKTGRFTSASNPILTGFDNVGDGHSEPMGWEVHINFNITHSSDIEVYMDGFYTSNAPTTHRAIVEHGTRRQRQDNAGTTFYHDKFYLGSYIAHSHTSLYSVIRILNPHRQHSSIHTPGTSTVRYHAWGETVYVHPGVGTTIDYGMGNLKASGADQRLHGIRLVAQSGGLTGAYTIFAIK